MFYQTIPSTPQSLEIQKYTFNNISVISWLSVLLVEETFTKSKRNIVKRDKIDTPNTLIHESSLSLLGVKALQ